jgi:hypothetical protein
MISTNEAMFLHHEPCPDCGSPDNLARYSDGHAFCFGCNRYENKKGEVVPTPVGPSPEERLCNDIRAAMWSLQAVRTHRLSKNVRAEFLASVERTLSDALTHFDK